MGRGALGFYGRLWVLEGTCLAVIRPPTPRLRQSRNAETTPGSASRGYPKPSATLLYTQDGNVGWRLLELTVATIHRSFCRLSSKTRSLLIGRANFI